MLEGKTDFGFASVSPKEKTRRVRRVFESVAGQYDLMNDLMSFGCHRLWKQFTLLQTGLRPGKRALDLAGGTGDIAAGMARLVGDQGKILLGDVNSAMLACGRDRLLNKGWGDRIEYVQLNAEALPFLANTFDCLTIGFGLRNVTDKAQALTEMHRVLRYGGRALVLEFSKPYSFVSPVYDAYSFGVLPRLGKWITGDAPSYQYLIESIRRHPDQQALKNMMEDSGFDPVSYYNLSGGIVALHVGIKS